MPKIILENVVETSGTNYPAPFDAPCLARRKQAIGDAGGLTQFGAYIITLPPNSWSSQRHWHSAEDELVMILDGHPTLIDGRVSGSIGVRIKGDTRHLQFSILLNTT